VSFFRLIFIPEIVIKALEFVVPAIILFFVILIKVYDKTPRFNKNFNTEIVLVLVAVFISMFGAYYFHKQNFGITFMAQRFIYFFIFYYLLHALKPHPDELIRMMIYTGIIYAVFYLIQTVVFPLVLTTGEVFMDRGTLRIFVPGTGFLVIAYFWSLSKFLQTYHMRYFAIIALAILIFILLGTRVVLASIALATLLNILLSKRITSKVMAGFLILLCIIPAYFLFVDIFNAMFSVSENQLSNMDQNIRVKAAVFFLFEFFPNKLSYIIGNGVPSSHSLYGIKINQYKEAFGFFQSDIGIIGDYTKFGILFVAVEIVVLIRLIFIRLPEKILFLRYNFIATFLTMFTGLGIFCIQDAIVLVCLTFYIIDVYKDEKFIAYKQTEPPVKSELTQPVSI
jgi:hypothetical protein